MNADQKDERGSWLNRRRARATGLGVTHAAHRGPHISVFIPSDRRSSALLLPCAPRSGGGRLGLAPPPDDGDARCHQRPGVAVRIAPSRELCRKLSTRHLGSPMPMDAQTLIQRIAALPPDRRAEVEDFVDFLASRTRRLAALDRILAIAPTLEAAGAPPMTEDNITAEVAAAQARRGRRGLTWAQ